MVNGEFIPSAAIQHICVFYEENHRFKMKVTFAFVFAAVLALTAAIPEAPLSPKYGPPSAKYGPPGFQNGAPIGGDPLAEPASYNFQYKVKDDEAGLDFGHQEEREGDDTKGEYTVLLPDGRNMIVTYTADQGGYKPEIRFEEAKGGYPRGPKNGY